MKNLIYLNILLIMMMFIITLIINNSSLHPIFFMIMIIIYTMLMCLNMSLWKSNYLYSMLLFLMMISGLMNIFLYFSSLISNELMQILFNKFIYFFFIMIFMTMFFIIYSNKLLIYINNNFKEIKSLYKINNKFNSIEFLYIYPFNNITIMSMLFLLLTLFIIIKIINNKNMPMRKIN